MVTIRPFVVASYKAIPLLYYNNSSTARAASKLVKTSHRLSKLPPRLPLSFPSENAAAAHTSTRFSHGKRRRGKWEYMLHTMRYKVLLLGMLWLRSVTFVALPLLFSPGLWCGLAFGANRRQWQWKPRPNLRYLLLGFILTGAPRGKGEREVVGTTATAMAAAAAATTANRQSRLGRTD